MAEIFSKTLTKDSILERVGDIAQICDARLMSFQDGRAEGVKTVEVTTGSGLSFTLVPSRNLDISRASFNGMSLAWQSAVGESSPAFYQPEGMEWLKNFFGGLLTTCGISYSSHPCEDEGESLGLHGRIANVPAQDLAIRKSWDGDDYRISVTGTMREVSVFGHNLVLERTVETSLGAKSLKITDLISNAGFRPSPVMMLYHINPGWPVMSEDSRLYASVSSSSYFDERAEKEADQWDRFSAPEADYAERCYLHSMRPGKDGIVKLCLVNEKLNIGVFEKYPAAEFPYFVQWKMMGRGEYVVGLEPGNITGNRAAMREDGSLEILEPGATRRFSIELGVLSGKDDVESFISEIRE